MNTVYITCRLSKKCAPYYVLIVNVNGYEYFTSFDVGLLSRLCASVGVSLPKLDERVYLVSGGE